MTLSHPATDKYVGEEYFQPNNYAFPSQYAVSVTVANIDNGCAGIETLGDNYLAYALYLCASGDWRFVSYDGNGNPTNLDSNFFGAGGSHTLTVAYSPGRLDASIDGMPLSTTQPNHSVTQYIALDCDAGSEAGSADFSHFVVTA